MRTPQAFLPPCPGLARSAFLPPSSIQPRRPPAPTPRAPPSAPAPAHAPTRAMPSARMRRGFKPSPEVPSTLYDAEPISDVDFNAFDFGDLRGRVVLAVNVASTDDATDAQYKMLAELLDKYHKHGLEVLAFPSNWYGQNERGTHEEIKEFVHGTYSKQIRVMSKTDIEWNQVFALGRRFFPGEVIWNFHGKFLFGRKGLPVARFDLLTTQEFMDQRIGFYIHAPDTEHMSTPPNEADIPDEDDISVLLQQGIQVPEDEEEVEEPEPDAEADLDFDDAEETE